MTTVLHAPFMCSLLTLATVAPALAAGTPAPKQDSSGSATTPPAAEFDHLKDGTTHKSAKLSLGDGDQFNVLIHDTCKSVFKVTVNGVSNEDSKAEAAKQQNAKQQVVEQARQQVAAAASDVASKTQLLAAARSESQAIGMLQSDIARARTPLPASHLSSLGLDAVLPADVQRSIAQARNVDQQLASVTPSVQASAARVQSLQEAVRAATDAKTSAEQRLADAKNAPPPTPNCVVDQTGLDPATTTHKEGEGVYEVAITRIDGKSDAVPVVDSSGNPVKGADGQAQMLYPTMDYVTVPDTGWTTVFSAGVTVSSLTNPKYSLQPGTSTGSGGSTTYTVTREKSSEDKLTGGLAAFATVYNSSWTLDKAKTIPWGITLGIGTNTGSKIQYYPGVSAQFGQLVVTIGANVGTVDTLPAGLHEGGTTTQQNALGTMASRTAVGGFLALTYTFGTNAQSAFTGALVPASGGSPK